VVSLAAVSAGTVHAAAGLSLNLRYNDPADPSEGGTWQLAAKTDDADGLVGMFAILTGIDDPTGTLSAGPGVNHNILGGNIGVSSLGSGIFGITYGQDLGQAVTTGVGTSGFGNAVADVLNNPLWDNQTLLVTGGTFSTATRPTFTTFSGNTTEVNEYDAVNNLGVLATYQTIGTVLSPTVRGDSADILGQENVSGTGLALGDADRDHDVDSDDLNIVLFSFNQAVGTWGDGDFDDDGTADADDLNEVLFRFNSNQPGPAITAIPEPSSIALVLFAAAGMIGFCRRC